MESSVWDRNYELKIFIASQDIIKSLYNDLDSGLSYLTQVHTINQEDTFASVRRKIIGRLESRISSQSPLWKSMFWHQVVLQFMPWPDCSTLSRNQNGKGEPHEIEKPKKEKMFSLQLRKATNSNEIQSYPKESDTNDYGSFQGRIFVPNEADNVLSAVHTKERNYFCSGLIFVCFMDVRFVWTGQSFKSSDMSLPPPPPEIKRDCTILIPSEPTPPINMHYIGSSGGIGRFVLDSPSSSSMLNVGFSTATGGTTTSSLRSLSSPPSGPKPSDGASNASQTLLITQASPLLAQSLSDAYFWEISNTAVMQGQLQRRVIVGSKGQEAWRPLYFLLEGEAKDGNGNSNRRLWYFSNSRSSCGTFSRELCPPSFIILKYRSRRHRKGKGKIETPAVQLAGGGTSIVLTGFREAWRVDEEPRERFAQEKSPSSGEAEEKEIEGEMVVLRARTPQEAQRWYFELTKATSKRKKSKLKIRAKENLELEETLTQTQTPRGNGAGGDVHEQGEGIEGDNAALVNMEMHIAATNMIEKEEECHQEARFLRDLGTFPGTLRHRCVRIHVQSTYTLY